MDKYFLFTHERLNKLPVPASGRVEYFDKRQQKLRLRVTSTGTISFSVVKKVNDKPKRVTIGKWPEVSISKAREEAIKILDEIRQGVDPIAEKRKQKLESTKLGDVLEQYLLERDLKPYTIENYRYKLKQGFSDWLAMPVSSITEDMILKRHREVTKKGKTTANTTMRVLRLTLNYAEAIGMIDDNPTRVLSKARLWHKNKRKDRVIPSNQLKAWHDAVESLDNQKAKVYLLMALYMGFRSSELLSIEWEYVNLKSKHITIFDTKNRTDHRLPIPDVLIPYIKELKKITGKFKWLFAGGKPESPMAIPAKPIKAVIKASSVEFSPHDCRRTFATIAEAVNLPITMIKRLMNHVTTNDVTGGYIVTEDETLRDAINSVADYIQARVT
jgi:integrase